ncbi:MAG: diaminopimelate decarboxylase, partial [Saprospiraceae bacterium]
MEVNNDRFEFSGGVDALSLTDKYDSPLYVYDFAIIERQYKRLISAFDGVDLQINYACKANTNVNILRLIRGLGAGLDAVSIQEIRLGLHAGYQPNEILYTPNGVSM